MSFARDFYNHYPKVGFGHWPPVFYIVQASWTLLFGATKISLMALMAFLSALVALTVSEIARRESTQLVGVAAGLVVLLNPRWQVSAQAVMAEVLLALLVTWAVIAYAEYLHYEDWRYSLLFGILAAAAILTKGTGIELSLIPPLSLIMGRRFGMLKKASFWLPLVPVVLLCSPWYLLAPGSRHQKVAEFGGLSGDIIREPGNALDTWAELAGPIVVMVALAFLATRICVKFFGQRDSPLWTVFLALLLSTMIFRSFIFLWASRFLMNAVPLLGAVASIGVYRLARRIHSRYGARGLFPRPDVAAVVLLSMYALLYGIQPQVKPEFGFRRVAEDIILDQRTAKAGILVLSDEIGEGSFTAEVALHDQRPNRYVLRGSKLITKETWNGDILEARTDLRMLQKLFEELPVSLAVVDLSPRVASVSRDLFLAMVKQHRSRWEVVKEYPRHFREGQDSTIAIFRLTGSTARPLEKVVDQLGSD
jgi:hypothetical protein